MKNNKGFTLIELVMVIAIMGIFSFLLLANISGVDKVNVSSTAWKVQSDIRYVHQLAMSTGRSHAISFYDGGNYNGGYYVIDTVNWQIVTSPETREPMQVNLNGIGIANPQYIEFNSRGEPIYGRGNVELVSREGETKKIYVVSNTGAVVIDDPVLAGVY